MSTVRTAQLYVELSGRVIGPFSAPRLQSMARSGLIGPDVRVSPDGRKWVRASSIRGLFPRQESSRKAGTSSPSSSMVREQLRAALKRMDERLRRLPVVFHSAVAGGTILFMALCGALLFGMIESMMAVPRLWVALLGALPPAMLCGLAGGCISGRLALRWGTGLSALERRCIALHVPYNRVPSRWPGYLSNWIYGGDWLLRAPTDEYMPYLRVFLTGPAPETMADEVSLWSELLRAAGGQVASNIEVGRSARELVMLEQLPEWSRRLEPGASLLQLEKQIGTPGRKWGRELLSHAADRLPELQSVGGSIDPTHVAFEFQHIDMPGKREALLVLIRPRRLPSVSEQTQPVLSDAA